METPPIKVSILVDDLLFHSSHGLCRVSEITPASGAGETSYVLLPLLRNQSKSRFIIPAAMLADSGFNKLMSVREANSIMEYFKTGRKKDSDLSPTWAMAAMIHLESSSQETARDVRKRQKMAQCVKGLAGELAYVLQTTVKEICDAIRKNLELILTINPIVLVALSNAENDN